MQKSIISIYFFSQKYLVLDPLDEDLEEFLELLLLQETEELLFVLLKFDCDCEKEMELGESVSRWESVGLSVLSEVSVRPVERSPEVTSMIGDLPISFLPIFSPDVNTDVFMSKEEKV